MGTENLTVDPNPNVQGCGLAWGLGKISIQLNLTPEECAKIQAEVRQIVDGWIADATKRAKTGQWLNDAASAFASGTDDD